MQKRIRYKYGHSLHKPVRVRVYCLSSITADAGGLPSTRRLHTNNLEVLSCIVMPNRHCRSCKETSDSPRLGMQGNMNVHSKKWPLLVSLFPPLVANIAACQSSSPRHVLPTGWTNVSGRTCSLSGCRDFSLLQSPITPLHIERPRVLYGESITIFPRMNLPLVILSLLLERFRPVTRSDAISEAVWLPL